MTQRRKRTPQITEKIDVSKISIGKIKKNFPFFVDLKINTRQTKFIVSYVENEFCGRIAYRQAGYNASTDNSMDTNIAMLLKNPKVKKAMQMYIEARLADAKDKLPFKLFENLYKCCFYDIADFLDDEGNFKSLKNMPKNLRTVVHGYEKIKDKYGNDIVKIKFADKDKSRDVLIKLLEMIKDKMEIDFGISDDAKEKISYILNYNDEE